MEERWGLLQIRMLPLASPVPMNWLARFPTGNGEYQRDSDNLTADCNSARISKALNVFEWRCSETIKPFILDLFSSLGPDDPNPIVLAAVFWSIFWSPPPSSLKYFCQ